MKRTNLFYRIITLSLLLIAISSIWTPCSANAAEQSHDISVTLTFFDEEATDSTPEDYQANTFRLQRGMDGTYVTAVYDTLSRCYIFTGYTFHESCATEFFCGMDSDRPELLTIKGLPTGSYSLRQFQTTVGYMLLRDPVSIGISDTGTTVNGDPVTPDIDNTVHFTIVMTHGYDIPMGEPCWICWSYRYFGFNIFLLIPLLIMLISFTMVIVLGRSMKKSNKKSPHQKTNQ